MESEIINLAATCISAVAACISTYFAARAIKDARDGRQEEFEAARPFLTFAHFGLKRLLVSKATSAEKDFLDPRYARIEGLISNDGKRHASGVSGAIVLIPIKENSSYGTFEISIADDVSPGASWKVGTAKIQVIPEDISAGNDVSAYFDPGFFVFVCMDYVDAISSRKYRQTSFMRWEGISNGVVSGSLVSGSREEWDAVIRHHSDFLSRYLNAMSD